MKAQPQAVGYTRVSTTDQVENGVSLDAQKAGIQKWADEKGYRLLTVYIEAGLSGGRASNRPALQHALNTACKKGRALVVYSLSRLARSTLNALEIADRLHRAHADLVSLSEQIDTTSPYGQMMFVVMAGMAELERNLTGQRTRDALQFKRAAGERVGRIPYGLDLDPADGVHLHPNPQEQEAIARMVEWRGRGWSYARIATRLEAEGIPAKNGPRWHRKVVRSILLARTPTE
ncbi:MAG TPA: recombinase family protein [Phycisphaerae bacterium]|nr:recombinase family protein [Phycisphaerae bacterium]